MRFANLCISDIKPRRGAAAAALFVLIAAAALSGCSFLRPHVPPPDHNETILSIVADLELNAQEDIYRFPYPVDLAGQNIFKATLVRTANFENLYPDKFKDSIAYVKALCHEKLGDYALAITYYEECIRLEGDMPPRERGLEDQAQQRLDVIRALDDILATVNPNDTLPNMILASGRRVEALRSYYNRLNNTTFAPVIAIELENAEVYHTLLLKNNRYVIDNGTERTIKAMDDLIADHSSSKNILKHYMMKADFYFELAKEYAALNPPESHLFEWDKFEKYIVNAQNLYYTIEKTDGYDDKLEGRYKLQAALKYAQNVRKKSF